MALPPTSSPPPFGAGSTPHNSIERSTGHADISQMQPGQPVLPTGLTSLTQLTITAISHQQFRDARWRPYQRDLAITMEALAIIERLFAAIVTHDLAGVRACLSPLYCWRGCSLGGEPVADASLFLSAVRSLWASAGANSLRFEIHEAEIGPTEFAPAEFGFSDCSGARLLENLQEKPQPHREHHSGQADTLCAADWDSTTSGAHRNTGTLMSCHWSIWAANHLPFSASLSTLGNAPPVRPALPTRPNHSTYAQRLRADPVLLAGGKWIVRLDKAGQILDHACSDIAASSELGSADRRKEVW